MLDWKACCDNGQRGECRPDVVRASSFSLSIFDALPTKVHTPALSTCTCDRRARMLRPSIRHGCPDSLSNRSIGSGHCLLGTRYRTQFETSGAGASVPTVNSRNSRVPVAAIAPRRPSTAPRGARQGCRRRQWTQPAIGAMEVARQTTARALARTAWRPAWVSTTNFIRSFTFTQVNSVRRSHGGMSEYRQ